MTDVSESTLTLLTQILNAIVIWAKILNPVLTEIESIGEGF